MSDLGRFTARGGERVETHIAALMQQAREALSQAIEARELRAVVLIGGYGRGEGGVVVEGGVERPHNNFDFLLITKPGADERNLKARADRALAPLALEHGIGMDVGVVREDKLARSTCLVMWYDMRYGHKTLLGDASFVPGLERFRADRIVAADVRNLLVNRGTLLLINELLEARLPGPNDAVTTQRAKALELDKKTIVKHAIKAIIGYGDALLFFLGDYHFSYVEKQRRMKARNDVPASLKRLYDEAMEFRFAPDYPRFLGRDLAAFGRELRRELAGVHLTCEQKRLGERFDWPGYLPLAYRAELAVGSPREAAKKLVSFVREPHRAKIEGKRAKLGFRCAGPRGHLSIVFPYVAYDVDDARSLDLVGLVLETRDVRHETLLRAYLRAWSVHGDTNFESVIRKHGLSLEPPKKESA